MVILITDSLLLLCRSDPDGGKRIPSKLARLVQVMAERCFNYADVVKKCKTRLCVLQHVDAKQGKQEVLQVRDPHMYMFVYFVLCLCASVDLANGIWTAPSLRFVREKPNYKIDQIRGTCARHACKLTR